MRRLACIMLRALLTACLASAAHAQTYPAKPVRLIIPFPAGGETDLVARLIAQRLTEVLGQNFIPDNRTGAARTIGAELAAKAPPDGYTLLMATPGPLTINPNLRVKMPYEARWGRRAASQRPPPSRVTC